MTTNCELMLHNYFMARYLIPDCDDKAMFDVFAEIFFVRDPEALYAELNGKVVRQIDTLCEYAKFERIDAYLTGEDETYCSAKERDLIKRKGLAITEICETAKASKIKPSEALARKALSDGVNAGNIVMTRLFGILQCAGIFVEKNLAAGIIKLNQTAIWNDPSGILAALYYDEASRPRNLNRLYSATAKASYSELIDMAERKYSLEATADAEAEILQEAFARGLFENNVYLPATARILASEIITLKDKKSIIFSGNKDTASLPLALSYADAEFKDDDSFFPLKRTDERERVFDALNNSDLRRHRAYLPPCLVSDERYILDLYGGAIRKAASGINSVRIDIADLDPTDLELNSGNVFLRNIDETKTNVFLIYVQGDTDAEKVKKAVQTVTSSKTRLHLTYPDITLNMSAIIPVFFCDSRNFAALRGSVSSVDIAPVSSDEKEAILRCLLNAKRKRFELTDLVCDKDVEEKLIKLDLNEADTVLDEAVLQNRRKGVDLRLTAKNTDKIFAAGRGETFGFGGSLK